MCIVGLCHFVMHVDKSKSLRNRYHRLTLLLGWVQEQAKKMRGQQ